MKTLNFEKSYLEESYLREIGVINRPPFIVERSVNVRVFTRFERFIDKLFGCRHHAWGFPHRSEDINYPRPYDSHQNCSKCGNMRFYQFGNPYTAMRPGALFRMVVGKKGST